MDKKTKITKVGRASTKHRGSVNVPIYQTSTILFETLEEWRAAEQGKSVYAEEGVPSGDYGYGLAGTPTTFALADAICEMEQGHHALLTPSGLSAITTSLLSVLKTGDHVLVSDSVYGPARRFCSHQLKSYGIDVSYYDPMICGDDLAKLVQPNTKVLYLESPGSLTFEVQDLASLVTVAKERGLVTIIDNSWAAPLFLQPLTLGIDIEVIALTKFSSGHSDVLMGAIVINEALTKTVSKSYKNLGIGVSPQDCSLVLRGLRTVAVRLDYQQKSAVEIAAAVQAHAKVKRVIFPALAGDAGHEQWKKDFSGAASLFSFELDGVYSPEALARCVNGLAHVGIGVSWGGYESLIIEFDPQVVRSVSGDKFDGCGSFLRVYVGLEATEDLKADLLAGLDRL